MGPMADARVAKLMLMVFVGVMLAGCLGGDELDPENRLEPHTRIAGWGGGGSGEVSCFLVSSLPDLEWCMDGEFGFADFRCDPPQLVFALLDGSATSEQEFMESMAAAQDLPAPAPQTSESRAYVYCEYALQWSLTARSVPPDSRFRVTGEHDGDVETSTCDIPLNGACTTSGRIDGAFRFHGPDESVELVATVDARIETIVPRQPPPVGGAGGAASWDTDMELRT